MVRKPRKPQYEDFPTIEITPLVDVVFLLLIFFLLTAVFVQPGIDIALPEAATAQVKDRETPYTIVISRHGSLTLNNDPATLPDIGKIPKGAEVLILEDQEGPYGVFVEVLDALQEAGIHRISIAADEKSG